MPGHFDYAIENATYNIQCDFKQTGTVVKANFIVTARFRSRVSLEGVAKEDGNFFVLQYQNLEPEFNDYGSLLLEYDGFGTKLTGFFIGRETGHKTLFVLASIALERMEKKPKIRRKPK